MALMPRRIDIGSRTEKGPTMADTDPRCSRNPYPLNPPDLRTRWRATAHPATDLATACTASPTSFASCCCAHPSTQTSAASSPRADFPVSFTIVVV